MGSSVKCLNCSFINPEGAKFCQNCGKPLEKSCPNCGTANPNDARFCKNCGFNLAAPAGASTPKPGIDSSGILLDPRHARLAAAAPSTLVEKVRAADQRPGERRVVTALFADVVGSTSLAEQLDPEDWTAIMNRAFDVLTPVIYRYEGTIARLMGDALLAFFGAPVAHEDDPVRAARASLDLIAAAHEYAETLRPQYGIDFAVRVGLNTGPVVVGEVGSNLVYEYTAMGDAINLAARMQTAARPMTTLVSENTYRLIAPAFEFTDLGSIAVKGKNEPVHVFELGQPKSQPGRLRGLVGLESPMVGRDSELETLLKLGRAVQAGLGRAALIVGEPGIGKSRLIDEWQNRMRHDEGDLHLQWAEGHCLSYGQGLAYHLLIDLMRSLVGISPGDNEAEARATLHTLCSNLFGAGANAIYPYLGQLLSLQLEGAALERIRVLDPQALQAQTLAALRQLLRVLANRRPLVMVLDDIHWADPSSVDLLGKLIPLAFEAPLMFCMVTRDDRDSPGWNLVTTLRDQMGASLTELNLRSLTQMDSQQLVNNLVEASALPDTIHQLILSKAEGNPLFVEEVIRMLVERGILIHDGISWQAAREVESIEIPDTLQSLLLARIDRLPEDAKHTLRVAAVIGRQFSVRVLQEVLKRQAAGL